MKILKTCPLRVLSVIALLGFGGALLRASLVSERPEVLHRFNRQLYDLHMASAFASEADILRDYEWQQVLAMPLLIVDTAPTVELAGGVRAVASWEGFSDEFVKGLVPTQREGITYWPVSVVEDAGASPRRRLILNASGEALAEEPVPPDYDPAWWVKERYGAAEDVGLRGDMEELLALFDGARLVTRYELIDTENLIRLVWRESIEAAAAAEPGAGGGTMMRGWEGGAVTTLQFVAVERQSNGYVRVTLAYPEEYRTNSGTAFEVFTCDGGDGLMDFWWEPGATTNADSGTNWVEWTDTEATNAWAATRFYVAAVSNDADGDGFTDGREFYVCHTDETDSNSYPVTVSGTISYTGSLSGLVRMVAVTDSNSWAGCMETIPVPGAYTNRNVATGTSYWFKAYRDCNGNKARESWEPQGVYLGSATPVTNDVDDIDITMDDPDADADGLPDWVETGTGVYTGPTDTGTSVTNNDTDGDGLLDGNEVTARTDPNNSDTTKPTVTIAYPPAGYTWVWIP